MEKSANGKPIAIVIFGAAGDLTWRKLVPALYSLFRDKWLPERFAIMGMDMKQMIDEEFRQRLRGGVDEFSRHDKPNDVEWQTFASSLHYCVADFANPECYSALA